MKRRALALLLPLALAYCSSSLPPYETVPPANPAQDDRLRIALCYNGLTTSDEQLHSLAAESCGPGMQPQAAGRELINLNNCPLLMPERATFTCSAH
jgi:hypothetical protein